MMASAHDNGYNRDESHELQSFITRQTFESVSDQQNTEQLNDQQNTEQLNDQQRIQSFNDFYREFSLTEDTTCGWACIRGEWLQKWANKKTFAVLYGFLSCMFAASFYYFNATISTIEKRFQIPSQKTGMITAGNDISQIFTSILVSYYTGRGHRPRWLAVSALILALFCVTNSLPYFIFGAGPDALSLTVEYRSSNSSSGNDSTTRMSQCLTKTGECDKEGSIWPQVILFAAQLIAGLSASLYHTLGISYADDNMKKSKSPGLLCFSLFFRMLGPAVGFGLASYCLKMFIVPTLHPTIDEKSPRWIGAWWIGWLVLAVINVITAFFVGLYPKHLPRALARKLYNERRARLHESPSEVSEASFPDMIQTVKRLLFNPVQILNNISGVFYYVGLLPYLMFLPKYLETVFTFSASRSSLITGGVEMVFSGLGMVTSGIVVSKYKPKARVIAGYNVAVGALSIFILLLFAFLGCSPDEHFSSSYTLQTKRDTLLGECEANCNCSYVKYSPVCAPALNPPRSFVSACHAGCRTSTINNQTNNIEKYTDCDCVEKALPPPFEKLLDSEKYVIPGPCSVQCYTSFTLFLVGICVLKFLNASGRLPNLLLLIRSVSEKDKPVAMGFGVTVLSLFAFIPAPILFGYIMDKTCLIWGKTCTSKGNCWAYDLKTMRYMLNITAAVFMTIGTLFDTAVWYYSKNLKMFDEKPRTILRNSMTQ